MAYFGNDAVNRVNLHSGIQALAQAGGGIFFLVFLVKSGVSLPLALTAQAAIMAGRFALRPAILPVGKRLGLRRLLILGALGMALKYPLLAEVDGVGLALLALCIVSAIAEVFYWPTYHAYFAVSGDAEHRGHQVGAREALVSVASVVAPLVGTWALVVLGPRPMFAATGLIQALSVLPLIGAPDIAVKASVTGVFRAARFGAIFATADGWFGGWYGMVWPLILFVALSESIAAYGGAMALAALVGAACGLFLGRHVDAGRGRRAVAIAYGVTAAVLILRASSVGSPLLAVSANALGAFASPLVLPALGAALYNLAKASPCPLRFHMITEAGWDIGCTCACLTAALLAALGVPLSLGLLLALPALATEALLLDHYFARHRIAPIVLPVAPLATGHE